MFSNFVNEAVSELTAIPSTYFVIFQRLSIAALLIALLIEIIIPYFKSVSISKKVATKRAKIDTKVKFNSEEQIQGKIRKIVNKLTRFIREPIYFIKRYFFHYIKTKQSIARMNRLQVYQKDKKRSLIIRLLARYYTIAILVITFLFAISLMIRMNYPA